MPVIELNITAENANRVVAALNARFPRLPGETDLAFAKRWMRNFITDFVHRYESDTAGDAIVADPDIVT